MNGCNSNQRTLCRSRDVCKDHGGRCPLSQGNREEGRALLHQQGGLPGGRGAPGCKAGGRGGVTGKWRRASPGAWLLGGSVAAALLAASASPRPRAVLRSWKPFLMSASRASTTHTSSCFPPPLLAEEPRDPQGHCAGCPEPLRERGGGEAAARTGGPQPPVPALPHQPSRPRPAACGPPPPPAAASSSQPWPPAPSGPCSPARRAQPVTPSLRRPKSACPVRGQRGPQSHHTSHTPSGRGGRGLGRPSWC